MGIVSWLVTGTVVSYFARGSVTRKAAASLSSLLVAIFS